MESISVFTNIIEARREAEIASLIRMGLTLEDAEDIYQEASVVMYEKMDSQQASFAKTPEDYLHGICKIMGYKRIDERRHWDSSIDEDRLDRLLELTETEDEPCAWDYDSVLSKLLSELNPRDYALLNDYYIQGLNMERIAERHHLASVEVARTTKCRIINRLRERARVLTNKYF